MQTRDFMTELMIARVRVALNAIGNDLIFGGGKVAFHKAPRIVT